MNPDVMSHQRCPSHTKKSRVLRSARPAPGSARPGILPCWTPHASIDTRSWITVPQMHTTKQPLRHRPSTSAAG
eukprot:1615688-Prymnesium_polylepis.1